MPIESYVCPRCNAPLDTDGIHAYAVCKYCGTKSRVTSADSAENKGRETVGLEIVKPETVETDAVFASAALWLLSQPYLAAEDISAIRWSEEIVPHIVPAYFYQIDYTADYSLEIGETVERQVYRDGKEKTEYDTKWHFEQHQVSNTIPVRLWSIHAKTLDDFDQCEAGAFSFTGDIIHLSQEDARCFSITVDGQPGASALADAAATDAEQRIAALYAGAKTRFLHVPTPAVRVLEHFMIRLALWQVSCSANGKTFHIYVNGSHPSQCSGSRPKNAKLQKRAVKGFLWTKPLLIMSLVSFVLWLITLGSRISGELFFVGAVLMLIGAFVADSVSRRRIKAAELQAKARLSGVEKIFNAESVPFMTQWKQAVRACARQEGSVSRKRS